LEGISRIIQQHHQELPVFFFPREIIPDYLAKIDEVTITNAHFLLTNFSKLFSEEDGFGTEKVEKIEPTTTTYETQVQY